MKILTFFLFNFLIFLAHAGTPEQDPKVAQMRTQFENASAPTAENIPLNISLKCIERMATPYDFSSTTYDNLYFFRVSNGGYSNEGLTITKDYQLQSIGLIGETEQSSIIGKQKLKDVIRVLPNGDLIAEWSSLPKDIGRIAAISDETYGTVSYTVCPLK